MIARIYKKLPESLKRKLCLFLKRTSIPNDRFYNRISFYGKFKVKIDNKRSFYMYHFGGLIENETFWKGLFKTWEVESGNTWMKLCKESQVIFDIGANTGIYSLVAKTLNPEAKIYAFEPSRHTFSKLNRNIELNQFDIVSSQMAISNISSTSIFYDIPNPNQTTASLSPFKTKLQKQYKGSNWEYEVKTISLSDYIEQNNIEKIDLIKLDIELHEAEAIEGLGTFLDKFKPVILVEVLNEKIASRLNDLFDLDNYLIYHLRKNGQHEKIKSFQFIKTNLALAEWNYLVFHKEAEERLQPLLN